MKQKGKDSSVFKKISESNNEFVKWSCGMPEVSRLGIAKHFENTEKKDKTTVRMTVLKTAYKKLENLKLRREENKEYVLMGMLMRKLRGRISAVIVAKKVGFKKESKAND